MFIQEPFNLALCVGSQVLEMGRSSATLWRFRVDLRERIFQLSQHFRLQPVRIARARGHAHQSYEVLRALGFEAVVVFGFPFSAASPRALLGISETKVGEKGVCGPGG